MAETELQTLTKSKIGAGCMPFRPHVFGPLGQCQALGFTAKIQVLPSYCILLAGQNRVRAEGNFFVPF